MCLLPKSMLAVANRASFAAATCPFIGKAAREALPRISFTDLPRYNPEEANLGQAT
jgi:hypothetical protein